MINNKFVSNKKVWFFVFFLCLIIIIFIYSKKLTNGLVDIYRNNESIKVIDRYDNLISLKPNNLGYYSTYIEDNDKEFTNFLLRKEDKYFYYHFGINPFSIARSIYNNLMYETKITSSTITQQLTKVLLNNESDRNFQNKIQETIYAISLELQLSKDEILNMYLNSIYLGNQTQGVEEASKLYFNIGFNSLNNNQKIQILATINSPSSNNPFIKLNIEKSANLANYLNINNFDSELIDKNLTNIKKDNYFKLVNQDINFELQSLGVTCDSNCKLKIDNKLSQNIRDILKMNLQELFNKDVMNGAVVVIKLPENELLAIIGSPDHSIDAYGYKINMAIKPRPIGSTIKPFIHLKGFEKNLRPYTRVEDKEYKYMIGSGYPLYPKNYDYKYRGDVSLHYSLSNSLNVPTVKILEYIGLNKFYDFLLNILELKPIQPLENYQLGIALGSLEMDLLSLSYLYTIFPNSGHINELDIYDNESFNKNLTTSFTQNNKIADPDYIQLINKILNDRFTGVEQFGAKSSLNLIQKNYAVKTGTSMNFHDSWTIGYTPDFLVGVWVGNNDDSKMDEVSGQSGAGKTWHEVMNLLINSEYNKKSEFDFSYIKEYLSNDNIEYGLEYDDYNEYKYLLQDNRNIISPYNNDIFLLEDNTIIPLKSKDISEWYVNDSHIGSGNNILFQPKLRGLFNIKAIANNNEEEINITID